MAHADVALHARAAQVEVAVLEAQSLVDVVVGVYRERRHLRTIEHVQAIDADLDVAGRQPRVLGSGRPLANAAAHADDVFVAQLLGLGEAGLLRVEDDLRDAVAIAQVDEDQAAVIAAAIDPSVEFDRLSLVLDAKTAARKPISHVDHALAKLP